MTTQVFKFPDVGEGIHEGQLVEWLAAEGDMIKEDQPLCRVETDKAVVEIPSPVTGKIAQFHAKPGDIINVGQILVSFDLQAADSSDHSKAISIASSAVSPAPTAAIAHAETDAKHGTTTRDTTKDVSAGSPDILGALPVAREVRATPHTRALARNLGVDITKLRGTGRAGRVTDEDVYAACQTPTGVADVRSAVAQESQISPGQFSAPKPLDAKEKPKQIFASQIAGVGLSQTSQQPSGQLELVSDGAIERVPLSFLRKKIAEQMSLSLQRLAHVTHIEEADVTELMSVYRQSKARLADEGIKLSPMPYFIKALIATLREFPVFNSTFDQERGEIVLKHYYNIGIAVDAPEGLVVPVIKGADRKSIVRLAQEIADLASRGRERSLKLDELRGGTITITNIGPLGGILATPIINYPEVAIIGMHSIQDRPAVVDGEICIRKRMYLSISFDHQIIDGAQAARFMNRMTQFLAEPHYLLSHV